MCAHRTDGRTLIAGVLVPALTACGPAGAASTAEGTPSSDDADGAVSADAAQAVAGTGARSDPFFTVTLSGPAFPTLRTFHVGPGPISLNPATAGGFVSRFQDPEDPLPSEQGGFLLRMFTAGIGTGTLLRPMSYEHAPIEGGEDGWGIIVWPALCLEDRDRCARIRMRTASGTLEVTRYDQGEAISRPHAEGPTAIAATAAAGMEDLTGQTYRVEWAFHLIDS